MKTTGLRILKKLEALGIADNTLVFFTSDNGCNVGHHGLLGKGYATFPMNMFEESVKVPFIARCPGHIPAGVVNGDLVSHYDFMPTILDYLGFEAPAAEALPRRSFANLLRDGTGGHDAVVVCDEYGPVRMIRNREWKYVHRFPQGPHELYNLREDPREERNRIDDPAARGTVGLMRNRLESWFCRYVNPDLDGARLDVHGKGQIERVGRAGPRSCSVC